MQAKFIEEETQRRIEDVVMKRVEEELAKRKIDVDEEVMRKVEEAKKHVEHHLEGEYERRTKEIAEQFKLKEVRILILFFHSALTIMDYRIFLLSTLGCILKGFYVSNTEDNSQNSPLIYTQNFQLYKKCCYFFLP